MNCSQTAELSFPRPSSLASKWSLDPDVVFLNHGSYGACPKEILEIQAKFREELEHNSITFFHRTGEKRLDESRNKVAAFIGCSPANLVFVPNATTGVNTVLRSLHFNNADEILITNHEYNACTNAVRRVQDLTGASIAVAELPASGDAEETIEAVLRCITPRTRLVLLDHVVSQTASILPIEEIIRRVHKRGVETLIDGAHAPGALKLNLKNINATYYTGNGHKWLCGPKGSGFLYIDEKRVADIRPLTTSHGYNSTRTDRSRLHLEFDWPGTYDLSPYMTLGHAIDFLQNLMPGKWAGLRERNHQLLCNAITELENVGMELRTPKGQFQLMALLRLPPALRRASSQNLSEALFERYRIQTALTSWPGETEVSVRISSQAYNSIEQYRYLGKALTELGRRGV